MLNKISKLSQFMLHTLLILMWAFTIFTIGKNDLSSESLWVDEAGQFWMAKGLSHYSPPLSREGNLIDVVRENAKMNLDPGGFTILLHFWVKLSNSVFWLRMLPYTFFILSSVILARITYIFSKSSFLSLISLFYLPITQGDMYYYAFEIRAFSMEYFGIAISLLLFLKLVEKNTSRNLLLLTSSLAIFSTSRYSFIIFALIISLLTILLPKRGWGGVKYYLPILFCFSLIFTFSYRYQFQVPKAPDYTDSFMFKYLSSSESINIIKQNLLSTRGIYSTLLVMLASAVLLYSNIKKERKILLTALIVLSYNSFFGLLSFLGIHPWFVNIRWNLSIQILNAISLWVILGFIFTKLDSQRHTLKVYAPIVQLLFLIVILQPFIKYVWNFMGSNWRNRPNSISANYHLLNLKSDKMFFISESDVPTWRYLNEFGSLKNNYYPRNTVFGKRNDIPPDIIDYVIQSGRNDIDLLDPQYKLKYKNLSIYEPTRIYQKLAN